MMINPFLRDAECNVVDNEVIVDREAEKMIAWAAGIYEGEGTTDKTTPVIIAQKDTWILYKLQELYGGRVNSNGSGNFRWYLYSDAGRNLLKQFIPYLSPWRIKQIEDKDIFNVRPIISCAKRHIWTKYNTGYQIDGRRYCKICEKARRRR